MVVVAYDVVVVMVVIVLVVVVLGVLLMVVVAYDVLLVLVFLVVLVVIADGVVSCVVVIVVRDVLTDLGLNVLLMFLTIRGILFGPGAEKLFLSSSTNFECWMMFSCWAVMGSSVVMWLDDLSVPVLGGWLVGAEFSFVI